MNDKSDNPDSKSETSNSFLSVRTLFKGGGIVLFGLILELGISFLGKLIIAQVLGPANYGGVSLGITFASIGTILFSLGLNTGVSRFLPRKSGEEAKRSILVSAFRIAVIISFAVGVAGVLIAPILANDLFDNASLTSIFRIFAIAIPFGVIMRLSLGTVRGHQETLPKVIIQNIVYPITRLGGIGVAVLFGLGSIGVSYAYLASYVSAAIVGFYYMYTRTDLFDTSIDIYGQERELLAFSLPLMLSTAMTIILSDIDMYMLGVFKGTTEVGLYNVAYPLADLLTIGISAFGFLFMPLLSELDVDGEQQQIIRLYNLVTKWIVFLMFVPFLTLAAFPEVAIRYTFGAEYVPGASALSILAIGFFVHTAFGLNKNALTSLGYTRVVMIDDTVVAIFNIVLNVLLIPYYGLVGAACATTASYALLNILYSTQLHRRTGILPFTQDTIVAPIVGAITLLLTIPIFRAFTTQHLFIAVGSIAVVGSTYTLAVIRFGVDPEDIHLVLSFEERFGVDLGPLKDVLNLLIK